MRYQDDTTALADRLDALADGFSNDDRTLILVAGRFALDAHAGATRRSGDPFVTHPIAVAEILKEESLSAETIAAGLLHDTVEDCCEVTDETLRDRFGDEVADLVAGVTKIQQQAPRGTPQRGQLNTYRRLVLASAADLRVMVIKLADRLHNMRTISSLPPDRQAEVARETVEIYAPIAKRLGMTAFQIELQDRALRVLDPDGYEEAAQLQAERGRYAAPTLNAMTEAIGASLAELGVEATITTRLKSRYSIWEKMRRRGAEAVQDILALRVIVNRVEDCYLTLGVVHRLYKPRFDRFRDYIALPRENLYQSLHTTVIGPNGQPVEVQMRTTQMHEMAERGVAAHWLYKEQLSAGGPASTRRFIKTLARDHAAEDDQAAAWAAIKEDAFEDELYVFTPKGDIRLLPHGSTVIDFAYSIHTDIGHQCSGARVNGQLRGLSYRLRNGDVVEVLVNAQAHPHEGWLRLAATPRARQRIRAFLAHQREPALLAEGRRALHEELSAAGIDRLPAGQLQELLSLLGFDSVQSAYLEAAKPDRARQLVEQLIRKLISVDQSPARPSTVQVQTALTGRTLIEAHPAGCCLPSPAEDICGYVSLAGGIAVHRRDCRELERRNPRRVVSCDWPDQSSYFDVRVRLTMIDRAHALGQLTGVIDRHACEIRAISLRSTRGLAKGTVTISVPSQQRLDALLAAIRHLDGTLDARPEHLAQPASAVR